MAYDANIIQRAAARLEESGAEAVVLEVKDQMGQLAWPSEQSIAGWSHVNGQQASADALKQWNEGEVYTIARVHCFRDPALSNGRIGSLLTKKGKIWYDRRGVCWSSPADQKAADYISALCLELADMGFDEILLDDVGYPWEGEVHVLATGDNRPEDRTIPVSALLTRLSGELRERDTALSVYVYERLLPGEEVYSGLTAGVLAQGAGRVWLDKRVDPAHYEALLTAAGLDNPAARIVPPDAGGQEGSWYR